MFWATTPAPNLKPVSYPTFRVLGCRPADTSYGTTGVSAEQAGILHFWNPQKLSPEKPIARTNEKIPHGRTKTRDHVPKPSFTLSQVSAQLELAFSQYEDDDRWLENCRNSLSFLAINNRFPNLSLADFAKLELVVAMRGKHQYTLLLVHEHEIVVEGRAITITKDRLCEGLFEAIAAKVELVVRQKAKRGGKWIGA